MASTKINTLALVSLKAKSLVFRIVGVIMALFFALFTYAFIAQCLEGHENPGIGYTLAAISFILTALGVFFVVRGVQYKRISTRAHEYEARIALSMGDVTLQSLALTLGLPPEKVAAELRALLAHKLLTGCYFDEKTGELVTLDSVAADAREAAEEKKTVYNVIECPGCGAANRVREGGVGVCEHCGLRLDG